MQMRKIENSEMFARKGGKLELTIKLEKEKKRIIIQVRIGRDRRMKE